MKMSHAKSSAKLVDVVIFAFVIIIIIGACLLHKNSKTLSAEKEEFGAKESSEFSILVDGQPKVVTTADFFIVTSNSPILTSQFKEGVVYRIKKIVYNSEKQDESSQISSYCFESISGTTENEYGYLCLTYSDLKIEQTFATFEILKFGSPERGKALEDLNKGW